MTRSSINDPADRGASGNVIPIVFSANDKYTPYVGVAIQSIILNANPHNQYRIYVLHNSISAKHEEQLDRLTAKNITVQCLNIEQIVSSIHTPLPLVGLISKEAYYRILIPEIETLKVYPYVVYFDCDIIANTDVAGIVPQNIGNNLIAAVHDYPAMVKMESTRLERDFQLDAAQYINSGVLVINVPQWIQEHISQQCFDFLNNISAQKYVYMDQDVINAVCRNRIVYLDESWNYNWYFRYGDRETVMRCKAITDRIGENFHVLHFTTHLKPWCTLDHPYAHYFWKYAGQSPFIEEIIKTNLCSKKDLENELLNIRIGRTITFLPRKLSGGVKCIRDHGTGYTVRRVLYHMGLWEDEEAPKGPENRPKLVLHAAYLLKGKRKNDKE